VVTSRSVSAYVRCCLWISLSLSSGNYMYHFRDFFLKETVHFLTACVWISLSLSSGNYMYHFRDFKKTVHFLTACVCVLEFLY
jgi:hypothetical protein